MAFRYFCNFCRFFSLIMHGFFAFANFGDFFVSQTASVLRAFGWAALCFCSFQTLHHFIWVFEKNGWKAFMILHLGPSVGNLLTFFCGWFPY